MITLNLACGTILLENCINVDIVPPYDVWGNMLDLPFEENSIDHVRCDHGMEHLDYPQEANLFLREVWRVLRPGGGLTFTMPDLIGVAKALGELSEEAQVLDLTTHRRYHNLLCGTRETTWQVHKWLYTAATLKYVVGIYFQDVTIEHHIYDHGGPGLTVRATKGQNEHQKG